MTAVEQTIEQIHQKMQTSLDEALVDFLALERTGCFTAAFCEAKAIFLHSAGKHEDAEDVLMTAIVQHGPSFDLVYNLMIVRMAQAQDPTPLLPALASLAETAEQAETSDALATELGLEPKTGKPLTLPEITALILGSARRDQDEYRRYRPEVETVHEIDSSLLFRCRMESDAARFRTSPKRYVSGSVGSRRVLHGTMEIANQMNAYCNGLAQAGLHARSLSYYPAYTRYHSDYVLNLAESGSTEEAVLRTRSLALDILPHFEVFHFHFATSLALDHADLPYLRDCRKTVLMNFWGSECRIREQAEKMNPFIRIKFSDDAQKIRKLEHLARFIDHAVVADHELATYVTPYFKQVHRIPQSVDISSIPYPGVNPNNRRPLLVHAPTSPEIKGSQEIIDSLNRLRSRLTFDFILVQNKSHEEAMALYQKADIIIDSIREGCYGILAIESMAMGKPVVGWISDLMLSHYPQGLPIFRANPENLDARLEELILDGPLRARLGQAGREFALAHHDAATVGLKLAALYESIQE